MNYLFFSDANYEKVGRITENRNFLYNINKSAFALIHL